MPQDATSLTLTPDAFGLILDQFQVPLARFVRSLIGNGEDARDVVQEVFVDAWRAAQRMAAPFIAGGDERARRNWLYHAAYCDAVSVLRHRSAIRWESLDIFDVGDATPRDMSAPFEERVAEGAALRAALATLEPADVACLRLSVVEGFTSVELAQILEIAPDAARKRLSRAMQRLRAAYFAQDDHARERAQP